MLENLFLVSRSIDIQPHYRLVVIINASIFLETYFSTWEFNARHHMTASDAQSMSVATLLDLAGLPQDTLSHLHLGYTETWGAPDLRQAIATRPRIAAYPCG